MKQSNIEDFSLFPDKKGFRFRNKTYSLLVQKDNTPKLPMGILTVYPTMDCNLRCTYCYASSGQKKTELSVEKFKALLNDIVDPSLLPQLQLHFHGGGEPTYNPNLFKTLVEEFKRKCQTLYVKYSYTLTTNGTFGFSILNLIVKNSIVTSISWDGPDDIQNTQRPLQNGGESHRIVEKNMKELHKAGLLKRVRITVTPYNVSRLTEIVHYLDEIGIKDIQMEPASILGRQNENHSVDLEQFIHNFQEAYSLCCQRGIRLSGIPTMIFRSPQKRFCGAFGWNFVLTSTGDITACTRVQDINDFHADSFLLGPWISGGNPLEFQTEKRTMLQNRTTDKLPECAHCPLKYHCAGGCPMTNPHSYGKILKRIDDVPCDILLYSVKTLLETIDAGYLPPQWTQTE